MINELVKKYIGKYCMVSTGTLGTAAIGEITTMQDNWIEVSTKKGDMLLNADFVTNLSEMPLNKHKQK